MRWVSANLVRATLRVLPALLATAGVQAADYYRAQGSERVDVRYRGQPDAGDARRAALAREYQRLLREYSQARIEADEWERQRAAGLWGDDGTSYQEALQRFRDGYPDAALERLSEDALRRDAAPPRQDVEAAARGWLLRGKLLALRHDFAGAAHAYAEAVTVAPDLFDAWFQHGIFHQQQNRHRDARQGYERALALARAAGGDAAIARILNNLGMLHGDENRRAEARQAHEEALRLRRALAHKDPVAHLPELAATLTNLGVLHRVENRQAESLQAYEEALRIRRALALDKREAYLPDVAITLNNLGNLHRQSNRPAAARQAYEEALRIRRELALKDPETYLPDAALTLNNLGALHR
ncbi:MAG: tetratricopeptide repeat protein, partial [Burkholderiales bacterium]|nr:tetratricopeptide repeat protein [Burkholderiales bacterium]